MLLIIKVNEFNEFLLDGDLKLVYMINFIED